MGITLSVEELDAVVDYLCLIGNHHPIHFLWRPFLPDPKDDMVLELAVQAKCPYIISFNKRDFPNVDMFGVQILSPQEFLKLIGAIE
jgi:predicted nucleic acid-binding protein